MDEPSPEVNVKSTAPWTAAEIGLLFFVGVLCQVAVYGLLDAGGFYRWYYGGDELKEAVKAGGEAGDLARYRLGLWSGSIATLIQILLAPVVLRGGSGVTAADLGLTTRNLWRNVAAGVVFAVIFVPGAYALQALALSLTRQIGGAEQPHPFTRLGEEGLHPAEWVLLIATAVALAPLWEELYFRGIVQPWVMARQPRSGPAVLAAAFVLTLVMRADRLKAAYLGGSGHDMLLEVPPIATLLVLIVVYLYLSSPGRSLEAAGLFATAVLFAWVHVRVWPSPVALLWLALGLGWLRWRGGSLAGCVVLHAVFNAVACVMLLASPWWKPWWGG